MVKIATIYAKTAYKNGKVVSDKKTSTKVTKKAVNKIVKIGTMITATSPKEAIDLANKERKKAGLGELKESKKLNEYARLKTEDMVKNNYFSHNGGNYQFFTWMRQQEIRSSYAGEIIAMGTSSSSKAIDLWLNSPPHKKILLEEKSTLVGVGYTEGKWTMVFN